MAARSTFTRTSGSVITSAWANSLRDHVVPYSGAADGTTEGMLSVDTTADQLRVGSGASTIEIASYGQWQNSWSVDISQGGSGGTTTTYGRYARYGRTIVAAFRAQPLFSGSAGSAIVVTIPVTARISTGSIGYGYFFDSSTSTFYPFTALLNSTTTCNFLPHGVSTTTFLGTGGFTGSIAAGDVIEATLIYEAAS